MEICCKQFAAEFRHRYRSYSKVFYNAGGWCDSADPYAVFVTARFTTYNEWQKHNEA